MNVTQILIKAYVAEARSKPDVKIKIGRELITHAEFADMLEANPHRKDHVARFLRDATKMFEESKAFQMRMMSLAGVNSFE